jgi:hypothetical protein
VISSSDEIFVERYITSPAGVRNLASASFSSSGQLYERIRSRPLEFRFTPRHNFTDFSITYADLGPRQCSSVRVRNSAPWNYSWTAPSDSPKRVCLLTCFPGKKVVSVTVTTTNKKSLVRDIGGLSVYRGTDSGETFLNPPIVPPSQANLTEGGTWLFVIHGRANLTVEISMGVDNPVFQASQHLELEWPTELNVVNDEGNAQQRLLVIMTGFGAIAFQIIVGFVLFKEFQHVWRTNESTMTQT